uniref:Protein kinase domain-containing protein n=1 Tax=Arion vulgaris TaxID=1028688 RepID=A0A0B6ZJG5_9EUPU
MQEMRLICELSQTHRVDEESVVKLCDTAFSWDFFGNEYVYDEQRERYLPLRWMAPESITDGYYDMRTDVWSLAVLVWELLTKGCLPYHAATSSQEISNFITQGYILGKPDIVSESVFELLCSCWALENEQRPSITEISKSLGEILEADDDETYANAGKGSSHPVNNSNGNAVLLRQSPGGRAMVTRLSMK